MHSRMVAIDVQQGGRDHIMMGDEEKEEEEEDSSSSEDCSFPSERAKKKRITRESAGELANSRAGLPFTVLGDLRGLYAVS